MIDLASLNLQDMITIISILIASGAAGMLYYVLTNVRAGLETMKIYFECNTDGWQGCKCDPPCEYGKFGEAVVPLAQEIQKLINNKLIPIVNEKIFKDKPQM
jgi:hypothetical protein